METKQKKIYELKIIVDNTENENNNKCACLLQNICKYINGCRNNPFYNHHHHDHDHNDNVV